MRTVQNTYLNGNASDKVGDEFKYFATAEPTFIPQDKIYEWWSDQDRLPHIRQMTYDLLFIPAMSAETEHSFSGTKHTITPTRTCLGADIVEAEECLRAWFRAGF